MYSYPLVKAIIATLVATLFPAMTHCLAMHMEYTIQYVHCTCSCTNYYEDQCHIKFSLTFHRYMVEGKQRTLLVHRKGSTRAFPPHHPLIPVDYQLTGQPVLIGGTMGTCRCMHDSCTDFATRMM